MIEPDVFGDERGFFMETWHQAKFAEHGIAGTFVQDNHSRSAQGVLRGLHYQLRHPQGKLVRAVNGAVYDVTVDIRRGSPRFGQWAGVELSDDNRRQVYVPPGFAHGFCVLTEQVDFIYKCTDFYVPEDEHGIAWNDPALAIAWPRMDYTLSERDRQLPNLAENGNLPDYSAA
ncbi:MAG: dTDP-4-dehydrorhamnose 3,5-epimerase [Gammaproteobacteria bacterium]